jgi:hypothetical protein
MDDMSRAEKLSPNSEDDVIDFEGSSSNDNDNDNSSGDSSYFPTPHCA